MDYILPETSLIKIKTIEKVENRGLFEIEPLSPGYGVTIGNSLRRILLSSLEGAAITSVKIEGVTHQFATLPKIKEDVVEIILNLKMLRFNLNSDEGAILKLNIRGSKEVTGRDLNHNPNCQIANPEAKIATLSKGANLNMEIKVEKGRGYIPVERRKDEKLPIGTISVDSIFTPVKKVHFEVENTRVGGMTNFDKLTIEVTTDGSIDPSTALGKSAQILVEHFDLVRQACIETPEVKAKVKKARKPSQKAKAKTTTKVKVKSK